MGSEFEDLRKQVGELCDQLEILRQRVSVLEARRGAPAAPVAGRVRAPPVAGGTTRAALPATASAAGAPGPPLSAAGASLVGRTLVVLGGAYLFRALSDREILPPLVGAAAALLYALVWVAQSDRAAARGARASAGFHGVTGAAIAYLLLWETTAVFGLLAPAVTAALMLGVLCACVGVAARRSLLPVAWAAVGLHVASGVALAVETRALLPFAFALVGAGAAVEGTGLRVRWGALRAPTAVAADLAALALAVAAVRSARAPDVPAFPEPAVVAVLLGLPLVYLASLAVRGARGERPVSGPEIGQALLAFLLGLGGSAWVQGTSGSGPEAVGLLSLLLGAAAYGSAFGLYARRPGRDRAFHVCATFAVLATLTGSGLLLWLRGDALGHAWAAGALAALALGVRFDRLVLRLHGAAYAVAAAFASGLVGLASDGLLVDPAEWGPPSLAMTTTLGVTLAGLVGLLATGRATADLLARAPALILAALLVWVAAGLATRGLVALAPGAAGGFAAPVLAALRSGVIAALAIGLAAAGRRWRRPELRWLVAPVLAVGGVKLLWEDLRIGEPVALFVAFACFGVALIVTSRLLRTEAPAPS